MTESRERETIDPKMSLATWSLIVGFGGALFMSSGRYHHHVGSNIWHSAGAGKRDEDRAGLSWFAIEAADAAQRDTALARLKAANVAATSSDHGPEVRDPFGTRVRFSS